MSKGVDDIYPFVRIGSKFVEVAPTQGALEVYQRQSDRYQLVPPPDDQYYWLEPMNLFLGV